MGALLPVFSCCFWIILSQNGVFQSAAVLKGFSPTIFGREILFCSSAVWVFYCLCFRVIFWSFCPKMVFVKVLLFLRFSSDDFQILLCNSEVWVLYCLCFRAIFRSFSPKMVFCTITITYSSLKGEMLPNFSQLFFGSLSDAFFVEGRVGKKKKT